MVIYLTTGFHVDVFRHQQIISAASSQSIQILQRFPGQITFYVSFYQGNTRLKFYIHKLLLHMNCTNQPQTKLNHLCIPWPGQLATSNMHRLQTSVPQNWTCWSYGDCSNAAQQRTCKETHISSMVIFPGKPGLAYYLLIFFLNFFRTFGCSQNE